MVECLLGQRLKRRNRWARNSQINALSISTSPPLIIQKTGVLDGSTANEDTRVRIVEYRYTKPKACRGMARVTNAT
tara:strand:- start:2604 stop:2831 length:228 start_codon:yes stop_codon:yes gene_type:complete